NNVQWVTLLGFEAGGSAIMYQKLSVVVNAGYTYAYFTEIEKIILENNQAIGTVTLKNDPIPEIPPFEAIFKTSYSFLNNMLQPELVIVLALNQQAVSKSAYEKPTPGFVLFEPGLTYRPFTFATLLLGVKNLTNRAYTMHLNRNIIGSTNSLYEPGRTFYINLVIDL
ncbi:MAG: TonB-dependent receptor, partial [Lentimicrobiaceae bacterium]|nr:TonB-dependent receptor [Lentimicrobiaceae bacterium]